MQVCRPPAVPRRLARARHQEGPHAKRARSLRHEQQNLCPALALGDLLSLVSQLDRLKACSLRRRQRCKRTDLCPALVQLGLQDGHTVAHSFASRQHGGLSQVGPDPVDRPCVEAQGLQARLCLADAGRGRHQVQLDPERSQFLAVSSARLRSLCLRVLRQRVQLASLGAHQVSPRAQFLGAADEDVGHPVLDRSLAIFHAEPGETDEHQRAYGLAPARLAEDDQAERRHQRDLSAHGQPCERPALRGDPRAHGVRDA